MSGPARCRGTKAGSSAWQVMLSVYVHLPEAFGASSARCGHLKRECGLWVETERGDPDVRFGGGTSICWCDDDALEDLKSQKKKILEEVMEKETYKTAKLILERFDPESNVKEAELPSAGTSATPRPGQEIRQRTAAQRNASTPMPATPKQGSPKSLVPVTPSPNLQRDASALSGPPERTVVPPLQSNIPPRRPGSPATSVPGMGLHPPGPPLARPILPRERGVVDRVIEYLVGDGPQNRYALICQQCCSHNGMALKEEFEYIESEEVAQIIETNKTEEKAPSAEQLNDSLVEEVEKESSENVSTTEDSISDSAISTEQSEESLVKAE
ncbi:hypothetical protein ASZ78_002766 [Callipepla squamata]|uniref:Endoplasmic reticulum junction formation protein lunapark n=1 Tax=Callipepla squamata TaxID=9009 RepID=A0A226NEA8_CALSU|nr:hypothetical protein ASZ78_002766 [Callipepla squamata]